MSLDLQTRRRYMKAMGIPVWIPIAMLNAADSESSSTPPPRPAATDLNTLFDEPPPRHLSQLDHQQTVTASAHPSTPQLKAPDCSGLDWEALQKTVKACELCKLHKTRTQTVFGTGHHEADWMIVGEAPGAEEDRQGLPFVGRAGQLLNNMLSAIGLQREQVYICNILKCRPPNNRDPKPEESALCRAYLQRQITLVNPRLILVVGRIAAHNLLQTDTPLGRLRGKLHYLPGSDLPVIVTYHPAYLLRQPREKRKVWQDLLQAKRIMQEA